MRHSGLSEEPEYVTDILTDPIWQRLLLLPVALWDSLRLVPPLVHE